MLMLHVAGCFHSLMHTEAKHCEKTSEKMTSDVLFLSDYDLMLIETNWISFYISICDIVLVSLNVNVVETSN